MKPAKPKAVTTIATGKSRNTRNLFCNENIMDKKAIFQTQEVGSIQSNLLRLKITYPNHSSGASFHEEQRKSDIRIYTNEMFGLVSSMRIPGLGLVGGGLFHL